MASLHFLPRTGASLLILAMVPMATPAIATTVLPAPTPAPRPAPSGVMGPPDGLITPGPSRPTPSPSAPIFLPPPSANQAAPRATPSRPLPTDTARPAPRPTPAPASRPLPPQQRPSVGALPPTSGDRPVASPASGGYDINATSGLPAAGPVAPLPEGNAASTPSAETAAAPAPAAPVAELPSLGSQIERYWPWLAGVSGLIALLLGWWLMRRRPRPLRLPAPEQADVQRSEPLPAPTLVPVPAPQPATPKPMGRRADLALTLEPLSAQSTLLNLRIRYAVTVHNSGSIAAAPVSLRMGMFAGSQAHPQGIAQWLGQSDGAAHDQTPVIAPGESFRFEGELAAPLEALNPMVIEGRTLAIPILAVDVRYGHEDGEAPIAGQAARAFVVGRDSGKDGAKLAPFRLDHGPTSFAPLGQRDTGIGVVA